MRHRAAKFVSAISAGVVVSVPFAAIPLITVEAAEECVTKPREVTPPGQHWYYLIDRGSKRRCWYLHQETATSSHAAISRRARRAAIVAARESKSEPAARESEPAMTLATRDAYAEFGLPQGDDNVPQVSQQTLIASDYPKGAGPDQPDNVSGEGPQSVVASRWPEPAGVPAASSEPPPASFVVASATPDAKLDAGTEDLALKDLALKDLAPKDLAPKAPPVVLASAETSATPASLKSLLLATFGAITISGFAGSSVYLLAQRRRRPQGLASLSHGAGRPSAEWVDRTRPPPWLYRDRAHEAEASAFDRRTRGLDEMG
jgi:hypothetical protein